ncbi:MAG: ABC transporter [Peptococcaceae bacterium]|nr:ABC transporter [Peptococcaceae bacterium]
MRFFSALKGDIRYHIKYGFYFLYMFISALYIIGLFMCPYEYKGFAASIIILTDPAMLGSFFIGGIWLLERQEGLHRFWGISPLKPLEYVLSKAVSLAFISALSAVLIVAIGLQETHNYLLLTASVFMGSVVFNIIGLIIASYARSVNHYMLIAIPPVTLLTVPSLLTAFGSIHPLLEISPGTALWRMIGYSLGIADTPVLWVWGVQVLFAALGLYYANCRIPAAMQTEGNQKA